MKNRKKRRHYVSRQKRADDIAGCILIAFSVVGLIVIMCAMGGAFN